MANPVEPSPIPESPDSTAAAPPWLEAAPEPVSPHEIINARRAQLENAEALRRARAL